MLKTGLRQQYINLLEREDKNIAAGLLHSLLIFLSWIYGAVVAIRNFAYNKKIIPIFTAPKKVISLGNLSWGGTGKTTLAIYLYQKLSPRYKIAVLRRGYGEDENKLISQGGAVVYAGKNRAGLAEKLSERFDLFILDDGFQHRKLSRDCDIVIMSARELKRPYRLIPAQIFREPLASLRRADILVINHADQAENIVQFKAEAGKNFPNLKIFTANYKIKKFFDGENNLVDPGYFNNRRLAALTATGYPGGFFNLLCAGGVKIVKKITYPDHYELNTKEFAALTNELARDGINDIIITRKDRYHFPALAPEKIRVIIMDIEMVIDNEEEFLREVGSKIQTEDQCPQTEG